MIACSSVVIAVTKMSFKFEILKIIDAHCSREVFIAQLKIKYEEDSS